ncbi:hypothetical protein ACF0H5_010024 [Mactra antiquata]
MEQEIHNVMYSILYDNYTVTYSNIVDENDGQVVCNCSNVSGHKYINRKKTRKPKYVLHLYLKIKYLVYIEKIDSTSKTQCDIKLSTRKQHFKRSLTGSSENYTSVNRFSVLNELIIVDENETDLNNEKALLCNIKESLLQYEM